MGKRLYSKKIRVDKASIWKEKSPLLSKLEMELTERCNNNCIHCCINLPVDDLSAREKELSTEETKEILKEAASLGCLTVTFTGGEPLLREDFEELYLFARRLGLKVGIFTNATLITPHLAEVFSRIPPLEKIEISLYGMKERSYEMVSRVSGSFEAAWRGINLLLEKKVPFVVKNALLPPNKEEIEQFETWTAKVPWMDSPPSYSMFFDLRCHRDSMGKNILIKKLRVSPQEGIKILLRNKAKYISEMREFCSKFTMPPGGNLFTCGAGAGGGSVDAYGHLQPCLLLRHPDTLYDLKKGSIRDALKNFFPALRRKEPSNREYLNRCARCFLKGLCEQCPAKSWMEHGTLDKPVEYLCEIAHTEARCLGLLKGRESAWKVKDWKERIKNFSGKSPLLSKKQNRRRVPQEIINSSR